MKKKSSLKLLVPAVLLCTAFALSASGEDAQEQMVVYDDMVKFISDVEYEVCSSSLPEGDAGRLFFPDLDFSVEVWNADFFNPTYTQEIVNTPDYAAMLSLEDLLLVADHNNQGFECIACAVPYETTAYIKHHGTTEQLVCTANFHGHNIQTDLVDENYQTLHGRYNNGILMYTCEDCWQNVRITYWQHV